MALGVTPLGVLALQLVGKNIEQRLGVGAGIQVAAILLDEERLQLIGIGEVAVVGKADPVGGVDVERLGLGRIQGAGRRVAAMADADVAPQFVHVALLENVADQTVLLPGAERAIPVGHHAGSILATMLEDGQRIIDGLIDRPMADDADDATHVRADFLVAGPTALALRPAVRPPLRSHTVAAWTRCHQGSAEKPPSSSARARIPAKHHAAGNPEQRAEDPVRARDHDSGGPNSRSSRPRAAGEEHGDEQRQPSSPQPPEGIVQRGGEQPGRRFAQTEPRTRAPRPR